MKKIFKVSLAIFAVASMALAASTVMMADSVIIGGKGDADDRVLSFPINGVLSAQTDELYL